MKQKHYTLKEMKFLRENYNSLPVKDIANNIGHPVSSVYNTAKLNGIQKQPNWRHWELNFMRRTYPYVSTRKISEILTDRSMKSINFKAVELGLRKVKRK